MIDTAHHRRCLILAAAIQNRLVRAVTAEGSTAICWL